MSEKGIIERLDEALIGFFKQKVKEITTPPAPKPAPGPECEHIWDRWEDADGGKIWTRTIEGSKVGQFIIQVRECKKCGMKKQRKYGWGDYQ